MTLDISVTVSGQGITKTVCTKPGDGALDLETACNWNTRKLPLGEYTITATGIGTWGNSGSASAVVAVVERTRGGPRPKTEEGVPAFAVESVAFQPSDVRVAILFSLDRPGPTTLTIFSITGQRVATLLDQPMTQGSHTATWNGRNTSGRMVSRGIYVYQLTSGARSLTGKLPVVW